jgi:putative phosphoribosyl transferase
VFADRREAGERLGERLKALAWHAGRPLVAGLARGGVAVAAPVARALAAPLRAFAVRKISLPPDPEFAFGAVAAGGEPVWNPDVLAAAPARASPLWARAEEARREADRLQARYGADWLSSVAGRQVLLVDDGLATGLTALAALECVRRLGAIAAAMAAPVASRSALALVAQRADRVVVLEAPPTFRAVSLFFATFGQMGDEEVLALLSTTGDAPPDAGEQGRTRG